MILRRCVRSRRARGLRVAVPLAVLAVAVAACGGGSAGGQASSASSVPPSSSPTGSAGNGYGGGGSTSSGPATVAVASNGTLGKILVDGQGRTLYLFEKDSGGTSSCFDACAQAWPPLTTSGQPQVGDAAKASLLKTTTNRKDGTMQVVYQGHPLYYYQGDTKPGQTTGEGLNQFGAEWYALSPAGDKVEHGGS